MKSKVSYFDIKANDEVVEVDFIAAHKDTSKDGLGGSQDLDIYKVTTVGGTKVHYLYSHEVEL